MTVDAIKCPKCRQPLPDRFVNGGIRSCPFCRKMVGLTVFPALFRKNEHLSPDARQAEEDSSSCFYHENLNASVHCDACGRFLCDLCRVDMNGKNICPNCIMVNRETDKVGDLEKRRSLHCRSAILASFIGFLMPMLFVGQIIAVVFAVKGLMQKAPIYGRALDEKITSIFALGLAVVGALLGLMFWGSIFFD